MKNYLHILGAMIVLLSVPSMLWGQTPPSLGTASTFVIFTTSGAVSNVGLSQITGDVGTNSGSITGFGNVNGQMHNGDALTASATADLNLAYTNLGTQTPTVYPGVLLGGGQVFTPAVYSVPAASTLSGNLTLDGQNDPDACFVLQLNGALTVDASSHIILINGTKACNVFWRIAGATTIATGVTFKGNILSNGAILLALGDNLEGRALSIIGAIGVTAVTAHTPIGCGSPYLSGPAAPVTGTYNCFALLTANGALTNTGITHVIGDIGTNNGPLVNSFNPLLVNGIIHSVPDAATAQASTDMNALYTYLNGLPCDIELLYPASFGNSQVLTPHVYCLNAVTILTDTIFLDAQGNSSAVFVINIQGTLTTNSYSNVVLMGGTQSQNVFWKVEGAVNINDHSIFRGTLLTNNGAISMFIASTLDGRALSTIGAITTHDADIAINILPPTTTCPANQSLPANLGLCSANVIVDPPLTNDNCGVSTITNNFNGTANASGVYPVGITTVIWTVTDSHGLTATCSMTVTVVDDQNPTVTCPANITANATIGQCQALVTVPAPIANDNCSISTITNNFNNTSNASGTYPIGTTIVIWTATDAAGNTGTCSMTITVIDNQNPTISCPANLTVNATAGLCQATVASLGIPLTNDNCGVASVLNNGPSTYPVGTTIVTWTVTDIHGNTSSCSMTVTVVDNQNPTITCPANLTVNATAGLCQATVASLGIPVTNDNCGVASVLNNGPSNYPVGTTIVTWTVTDIHSNTSSCSMTVTVVDVQNPIINCPANIAQFASLGQCQANIVVPIPITSDNCSVTSVINSYNGTANASGTYPVGITNVIWTVTDNHALTSTCLMSVTISDNQNPTIACPANITQSTGISSCNALVSIPLPVTNDNCGIASVTNSFNNTSNASGTYPKGITIVIWTVTDNAGNTASCQMTITIIDNIPPTIICPANISQMADPNNCFAVVNIQQPNIFDNCGLGLLTNNFTGTFNASGSYPVGTTLGTWTINDISGNSASCIMSVTVTDNTVPTITCPSNITSSANPNQCQATVVVPSPFAFDNCGTVNVINSYNGTSNASGDYPVGITTVIWTATDGHAHTATCSMTVTVIDNQIPTIACPANVSVNTTLGQCQGLVTVGLPDVNDNCGIAGFINNYNNTNNASGIYPVGITTVIWTATDINGNNSSCVMTVTVIDNENPTIICPVNITANPIIGLCQATISDLGTPITNDNCGVASVLNNGTTIYQSGINQVIWTVTDNNGNTATCIQTITVLDNEPPFIICPPPLILPAETGLCSASGSNIGTPVTTDNCQVSLVINNAASTMPLGINTVIWTASDASGNIATCEQMVTVIDNQPPSISCPASLTLGTDPGQCFASNVNLGIPLTSDNCSIASTTNNAPLTYPVGITLVIWLATDGSGNIASCTQSVTVIDNQPPTIICPPNKQVPATFGSCTSPAIDLGLPTTNDNCSIVQLSNNAPQIYILGNTIVTWIATDAAGNTSSCSQLVTIIDTELPTIECPPNIEVPVNPGACFATGVNLGTPTTADNCTILSVTNNAPSNFPVGITMVIWTISDAAGNIASCSQNVTVFDNQPPVISCPPLIVVNALLGICGIDNIILETPSFSDNCSLVIVTHNAPAFFPVGQTIITWTATDIYGNLATCNQSVIVNDNQPPTIFCPPNQTIPTDLGSCFSTQSNLGQPVVTDNCGIQTISDNRPLTFPLGTTNIIWTVVDLSGNSSTCVQHITVIDISPPTIQAPPDLTKNTDPGICYTTNVILGSPIVTDQCAVVSYTNNAPVNYSTGITTIIWIATDLAGNSAQAVQTVTVFDIEPPQIICPNDVILSGTTYASIPPPQTSDNCGIASVINDFTGTNNASANYPTGVTVVTYTTTDIHGNTATCSFSVTTTCPPQAYNDTTTTPINTSVLIYILNNDTACYPYFLVPGTITVITPPLNGNFIINPVTSVLTYIPNLGYTGIDSLYYQVCDNQVPEECTQAWVFIHIAHIPTAHIAGSTMLCLSGYADLLVTFTGIPPFSIQVYDGTTTVTYSGILNNYYIIEVHPSITTTYTITQVQDASTLTNIGTGSATITIITPQAYIVTGGGIFCPGTEGQVIGLTGSETGSTYILYRNGIAVTGPIAGTGGTLNFGAFQLPGVYTATSTTGSSLCSFVMYGNAIITVLPAPLPYSVTGGGSCCFGCIEIHVGTNGSQIGVTYNLYLSDSILVTSLIGTGGILDFGYVTTSGIYTVLASNSNGCITEMIGYAEAILWEKSEAILVTPNQTICAGSSVQLQVELTAGTPPWCITIFDGTTSTIYCDIDCPPFYFTVNPTVTTTYTITNVNDFNNCGNYGQGSTTISVIPGSFATLAPFAPVCINNAPVLLSGGTPEGGYFSGNGISGGFFYTEITGPGTWPITYNYASPNGCLATATSLITVLPLPVVTFTLMNQFYCANASVELLTGNHAPFGSFSGIGIIDEGNGTAMFSPAIAGIGGPYTITYTYVDPQGCAQTANQFVTVTEPGSVSIIGLDDHYCYQNTNIQLEGSPLGGFFSGPGIVNGTFFNPSIAGAGIHTITYYYANGNCNTFSSQVVQIYPAFTIFQLTGGGSYCAGSPGPEIGLNNSELFVDYTLYLDGISLDLTIQGTGSAISFGYQSQPGMYTIIASISGSNCVESMSGSTAVTINLLTAVTVTPQPALCLNDLPALLIGGNPAGGIFTGPGVENNTFNPLLTGLGTFNLTYIYTNNANCSTFTPLTITVIPCSNFVISGQVTYNNTVKTPMTNTVVRLSKNNIEIATTNTDINGFYQFGGLSSGEYAIDATTNKNWGGVNSADALLVLEHFVGTHVLTNLPLKAANVDNISGVNSTDALMIARRFTHMMNYFPAGDWVFEKKTIMLAGNVINDFSALCFGDVNHSYLPPSVKIPPTMELTTAGKLEINSWSAYTVPVKTTNSLRTAALSMIITFPSEILEVTGVRIGNEQSGETQYFAQNGELRISWYSLKEVLFNEGSEFVTIQFRSKDLSKLKNEMIILSLDAVSETNDIYANTILNVKLTMPQLITSDNKLTLNVYPNPVNEKANFIYEMPEDGIVSLIIYNILGNEISRVVDNQFMIVGSHQVTISVKNLPQGIYAYKFCIDNNPEKVITGKMVINH